MGSDSEKIKGWCPVLAKAAEIRMQGTRTRLI